MATNTTTCSNLLEKMSVNFFNCKLKLVNQHGGVGGGSNKVLQNFNTVAMFDIEHGLYACEIRLLTSIEELISAVKNLEINLELEVCSLFYCKNCNKKLNFLGVFFSHFYFV